MWYMNEERTLLQQAFREFAETKVRPYVTKMETEDASPVPLLKEMGKLGFLQLAAKEEYGGVGFDYINYSMLIEEMSRESSTLGLLTFLVQMFGASMTKNNCFSEEILEKVIKPSFTGEVIVGMAGGEASGSTDFELHSATAKREGDEYIVNASKIMITHADTADWFIVFAHDPEAKKLNQLTGEGMVNIMVPATAPGVKSGHIENKLGLHGTRTGSVYFEDVRVPASYVIHPASVYNPAEMSFYGPIYLGLAEACLERTIKYLKEREKRGVSLWDAHESIRAEVAALHIRLRNYRYAVYGEMQNLNNGIIYPLDDKAIKIEGGKIAEDVTSACVTLFGGTGIIRETGIERCYRDAKILQICCGSNKTMLTLISQMI